MGIIKASKLIFDYIRRDEEDNIEKKSTVRLMTWMWISKRATS